MSDNTDYGFDLDSILAEFSSDSGTQDTEPPKPARPARPVEPVKAPAPDPVSASAPRPTQPVRRAVEPARPAAPAPDPVSASAPRPTQPVRRAVEPARPAAPAPATVRTEPKKTNAREFDPEFFGYRPETEKQQRPPKPAVRRAPVMREPEPEPELDEEAAVSPSLRVLLSALSLLLAVVLLLFVSLNVHPGSEAVSAAAGSAKSDLVGRLNVYMNNAASDALGELAYIKKQYTIDYSATSAPKPDESRFVTYSIDEADKVMDVIEQARTFGLLDGQDVIFNPSVEFYWDSDIRCYCDETILAICWKEKINDRVCSFVEVKLADGSQIRRKLVNDTFGSNEKAVASELSRSANAVIAMNADYYKYRDLGVCVYQGQLCRYETSCDVLFIDANGDFRMLRASELGSREDVEQYITDNNIQFSMSFGPILVRDGELLQLTGSYAGGIGEMYEQYSRSGIGQYDKLHYLIATVNHSQDGTPRATVNQFAEIIYGKGVQNAYNFDGGQTSEVLINNERYNYVDWDNEREVSDILYFATAIPEQEVG